MARLRDDFPEFVSRGVHVIAIGPEGPAQFRRHWREHELPFIGVPDPNHVIARRYRQEVNLFKLGRMPLVALVDGYGWIRYLHRGESMADIPENGVLLEAIDRIRATRSPGDSAS